MNLHLRFPTAHLQPHSLLWLYADAPWDEADAPSEPFDEEDAKASDAEKEEDDDSVS
jgi:hypothetical protein